MNTPFLKLVLVATVVVTGLTLSFHTFIFGNRVYSGEYYGFSCAGGRLMLIVGKQMDVGVDVVESGYRDFGGVRYSTIFYSDGTENRKFIVPAYYPIGFGVLCLLLAAGLTRRFYFKQRRPGFDVVGR